MSRSPALLKQLAARLVISPPPSTLGESTAVLKRLQSFGHVISFAASHENTSQNPESTSQAALDVNVVFTSTQAIEKAQEASPFTVEVNHNLPDPNIVDPYNIRNLQTRRQPAPKTMVCRLELQSASIPPGQSILSKGFSPSVQTRLAQSLNGLDTPPGIAVGLSVFHNDTSNIKPTPDFVDPVPNLTSMYRGQSTRQPMRIRVTTSSPGRNRIASRSNT